MRSIVKEQSWAARILFTIYALSFLLPALGHGDPVFGWQGHGGQGKSNCQRGQRYAVPIHHR